MSDGIKEIKARFASAEEVAPPQDMSIEEVSVECVSDGYDEPDEGRFAPLPDEDPGASYLPDDMSEEAIEIEARLVNEPLNDLGNGRRVAVHFGEDLAFVSRLGWFRWTGRVWEPDEDELRVRGLAHDLPGLILREIPHIQPTAREANTLQEAEASLEQWREILALPAAKRDGALYRSLKETQTHADEIKKAQTGRRKSHRDWARQTGNSNRLTNLLLEARVSQSVPIGLFNADPAAINCESGVLRFVPDEHAREWGAAKSFCIDHSPHSREDRITKICPAPYDPAAPAEVFTAFLERIQPDPQMREFLQRWFGYSLLGFTTEQKLCFFFGVGRNGKSTLVDAVAGVFGDYGTTVPIETLTGSEQRKGSDATPDLVRIPGARLVRASEPEEGQKMKEALIKALTGGEPILIRRMMQEFIEVVPEFKLTISGNHKPEIHGGDDGIWRRILLIPFSEQIPEDEVDPLLLSKLKGERAGILAWLVDGARKWFEDGLKIPPSVRQASDDYRSESDQIRTFLTEAVEVTGAPSDEETAKDLIDAFSVWQVKEGRGSPWSARQVSKKIKTASATFRTKDGAQFTPFKASTSKYRGVKIPERLREDLLNVANLRRDAG